MQTIAFVSQKGGTGKTTTAIGLAVAAHLEGRRVVIIDTDPQTNAANWGDRRQEQKIAEGPESYSCGVGQLAKVIEGARADGYDLAIIDTAGKSDTAATAAAKLADLVLIPVQSQVFDLETLDAVKVILGMAENPPAFVVITKAHPATRDPVGDMAEGIKARFGLDIAPAALTLRRVYAVAPETGQGPQEIEKDGKAAAELAALYAFAKAQNSKTAKLQKRA